MNLYSREDMFDAQWREGQDILRQRQIDEFNEQFGYELRGQPMLETETDHDEKIKDVKAIVEAITGAVTFVFVFVAMLITGLMIKVFVTGE